MVDALTTNFTIEVSTGSRSISTIWNRRRCRSFRDKPPSPSGARGARREKSPIPSHPG